MAIKCPTCGTGLLGRIEKCTRCGALINPTVPTENMVRAEDPQKPESKEAQIPKTKVSPKKSNKKTKKKERLVKKRRFLKFLLALVITAVVLVLAWNAFGNITLKIHASDVTKTLNGGSLDLHGLESDRDELPGYVKDMLGEKKEEDNPIIEANLAYLSARVTKVNGFFGDNTVEYAITAPDLEGFFVELDMTNISSSDELMNLILNCIPTIPVKERTVIVAYTREGLFGWRGSYKTVEFADAISGGMNTVYNHFYEEMIKDLEEALK